MSLPKQELPPETSLYSRRDFPENHFYRAFEDLEPVPERSIESELTYKTSLLEQPTSKSSFKDDFEGVFSGRRSDYRNEEKIRIIDGDEKNKREINGLNRSNKRLGYWNENEYDYKSENERYKLELSETKRENSQLRQETILLEEDNRYKTHELRRLNDEIRQIRLGNAHLLSEKDELEKKLIQIQRKKKEIEHDFSLRLEEALLLKDKQMDQKINELLLDSQYRFHEREKKLREIMERLQLENHQQKLEISSPKNNLSYRKSLEEILEEFELPKNLNGEEIKLQISNIKAQNNQMRKFIDSVLDMVEQCHPRDYFKERPGLKYVWKWLKSVLEKYMMLRKSSLKETNLGREENNIIIENLMENLKITQKSDILIHVYSFINENTVLQRIINKVMKLLGERGSLKDLEKKLDEKSMIREKPYNFD